MKIRAYGLSLYKSIEESSWRFDIDLDMLVSLYLYLAPDPSDVEDMAIHVFFLEAKLVEDKKSNGLESRDGSVRQIRGVS